MTTVSAVNDNQQNAGLRKSNVTNITHPQVLGCVKATVPDLFLSCDTILTLQFFLCFLCLIL